MSLRIIWFFVFISAIADARIDLHLHKNCKQADIAFEKVLGVKPSANNNADLLIKGQSSSPITIQCIDKCQTTKTCNSFIVDYNENACYWYKHNVTDVQEDNNEMNPNMVWFVKVCLRREKSCQKLWTFELIPGATLVGNDTKVLPNLCTRTECQQYCLDETTFACRSAKFRVQTGNYDPKDDIKGRCTLSAIDRSLVPHAFRVSSFNDEYFESQCAASIFTNPNEFCAYEEYDNATLLHGDVLLKQKTKEECKNTCETVETFRCRGFSLVPTGTTFDCMLHSEDSTVFGPRLIKENTTGTYFEKALCLNLTIVCSDTYMTVQYTPNFNYQGKMYLDGYSEDPNCSVNGMGTTGLQLKLPVLSEQCGIIRAITPDERTLVTASMIIQNNPLVQTQGDRNIKIGCIYGNDSNTLLAGTGIRVSTAPSKGSPLINSSGIVTPTVEMEVLDLVSQQEVSATQLGQELQLVIIASPISDLDIWASDLIAMTENSNESILLLDDRGCPSNPGVFPELIKTISNHTIKLTSTFKAFRFSSSPIVRFSVIVQFCENTCPKIDCSSPPRKKRELQVRSVNTINGTKVTRVNRTDFEQERKRFQMPLEYVMLVRKSPGNSQRLVLGDGKILIAGYDFTTNEVIFVVCCVVLVRRYKRLYQEESTSQSMENLHKNVGYDYQNHFYDNRRVHWADNGDSL